MAAVRLWVPDVWAYSKSERVMKEKVSRVQLLEGWVWAAGTCQGTGRICVVRSAGDWASMELGRCVAGGAWQGKRRHAWCDVCEKGSGVGRSDSWAARTRARTRQVMPLYRRGDAIRLDDPRPRYSLGPPNSYNVPGRAVGQSGGRAVWAGSQLLQDCRQNARQDQNGEAMGGSICSRAEQWLGARTRRGMQRLTYVRSRGRVGRQQQPTRPLRLMAQRHGQHFRSREGQIAVCFTTNGSSTASRVLLAAWIARVAAIPL
jgi:hypothetical protein